MTTVAKETGTIPEISLNGSQPLQLPLIPDPGKQGDIVVPDEHLDFSVRLGTSLAREHELDNRLVQKQLRLKKKSATSPSFPSSLPINGGSSRTTPSPRDIRETAFNFTSKDGAKLPRRKRESRTIKHVFSSYITESETPRIKFQRIINTVRVISSICLALRSYVQACRTQNWSFMEMYLHVKEDLNKLVVFNPQNFRRIEPERGRLKKILSVPGSLRTVEDIRIILALLRGNSSFQDYPRQIQIQLAQCMEYQSYETRRVILKQGHRPEAFYILLSGNVIANVEEVNPHNGRTFIKTVHELKAGATFGEIALIDGGLRTATIVCKTTVELLVILKDDFDAIIRVPLLRQRDEHVNFCRSVPLLRDFPCEELTANPSQFFYQFFKKEDTVVKNSRESKHIIVVKAGKCRVVSTFVEAGSSGRPSTSAASREMEQAFPLYTELQKIPSLVRRPKSEGDILKETICLGLLTGTIDKTRLADHGPDVQRPKAEVEANQDLTKPPPPLIKSKTLSSFFDTVDKERREANVTDEALHRDIHGRFWARRLRGSRPARNPADRKTAVSGIGRGPFSTRRSGRRQRTSTPFYAPEKVAYAQIAELNSGDVFGLESLVQKPTTTLSLVSDGAECIFISKRLFLSLANIKVLRVVTDIVQTYPSQEFIEDQVRQFRRWQKYKASLVQEVLNRHK